MKTAKKLARGEPRDLPGGHWYYVRDRSVDVVGKTPSDRVIRLRERDLRQMLSELRPKRTR